MSNVNTRHFSSKRNLRISNMNFGGRRGKSFDSVWLLIIVFYVCSGRYRSSLKTGPARPGHNNFVIGGEKDWTKIAELAMRIQHRQTYANRGFRFIHGFYVSDSIHKILKGSLQHKLKVASVWLFNPCSKVYIQSESVIYDHSTSTVKRKLTKVNCSDNEGNFYVPHIGPGRASF